MVNAINSYHEIDRCVTESIYNLPRWRKIDEMEGEREDVLEYHF